MAISAVLTRAEQRKQLRLARKQVRYEQVRSLHAEGYSARAIGRQMQMSFYTVRKYLEGEHCPVYPAGVKRGVSKLDHFLAYLTARWQAGCHNASQLWRELDQQGFTGSRGLVAKWAAAQRPLAATQNAKAPVIVPYAHTGDESHPLACRAGSLAPC